MLFGESKLFFYCTAMEAFIFKSVSKVVKYSIYVVS